MPRSIALTVSFAVAIGLGVTPRAGSTQSFYDASNLLPSRDPESGLGASVVDVNGDGRVDLYRKNHLLLQEENGRFVDVFDDLGYELRENGSFGAIFGDADNDGFVETFFLDLNPSFPYYLNRNGMRFVEHSNDSGIHQIEEIQGSVWTDFNRDGLLDLFVGIDGGTPRLFRNVGLDFFRNEAALSGFDYILAYGVAAADYDDEGDPDLMVTQCAAPPDETLLENRLYRNTDGTFENVSAAVGIVDDLPSWGVVWLDYDNDGRLDFYVVNTDHRPDGKPGNSTLYRNLGPEGFVEVTEAAGVDHGAASTSLAVSEADFDNDGWVDLFVADYRELLPSLYHNNGDGTFTDVWPQLALDPVHSSAVAVGDVNGDGWIDIFQPTIESDQLLLNLGGDNHFLMISLRGTTSNHFGVGSRIDLYVDSLRQVREITAGDGMTSQNHNLSAHFGLGSATEVDSVIVRWPSGMVDRLENVDANRFLTVVEDLGENRPPTPFSLVSPAGAVSSHAETLTFSWARAEDDDPVLYSLHVFGPGVDVAITDISETTASIDRSEFNIGATYRWTVTATDGYSVRAARYAKFVFGPTTSAEPVSTLPAHITRFETYPNPVVNSVTVDVELATSETVRIDVFDVAGRWINRIHDGPLPPGKHRLEWSPQDAAPGTYLLRLSSKHGSATKRLVVK